MKTRVPTRSANSSVNGWSTQPRLGANLTRPSVSRTAPGTDTPMPRHRTPGCGAEHLLDHLGAGLDDVLDVVLTGGVRPLPLVEHVAAERHQRRDDPVDADVDGHGDVVAPRLEHQRRPARLAYERPVAAR